MGGFLAAFRSNPVIPASSVKYDFFSRHPLQRFEFSTGVCFFISIHKRQGFGRDNPVHCSTLFFSYFSAGASFWWRSSCSLIHKDWSIMRRHGEALLLHFYSAFEIKSRKLRGGITFSIHVDRKDSRPSFLIDFPDSSSL